MVVGREAAYDASNQAASDCEENRSCSTSQDAAAMMLAARQTVLPATSTQRCRVLRPLVVEAGPSAGLPSYARSQESESGDRPDCDRRRQYRNPIASRPAPIPNTAPRL